MWNAECIAKGSILGATSRARPVCAQFRILCIPHSAFHIPHWSGVGGGAVMRVGVDVGGTFTDLAALTPDGAIEVRKVATTPDDPAVGMFRALDALATRDERRGTSAATSRPVPLPSSPVPIDMLIHGTTIATNALLERRGARVVLVTTRGFEDLLWLGRQDRAALYDLARHHPPPLVAREDVVPAGERMGPTGVLEPLTDGEVARVVAGVRALAPEAVAIALLFAFRDPTHERRLASALRDALPHVPVAASHEVLPLFREFERTSTTTVEAYLRPKVSTYLERLDGGVRRRGIGALRVMTSSGGTRAPAAAAARADEGGALRVGPESAGSVPGPACYGRGGERPTVTDACLALGWLDAGSPLADDVRLDTAAAERALLRLGPAAGGDSARVAAGIVAVAAAVMARALKRVSVARGLDPRRMALLPFGGAGALFGCQLADALGMGTIVIPPHPGTLSALGLASAAERADLLASFHRPVDGLEPRALALAFAPLLAEGARQIPGGTLRRYADCRFAGQGYEVTVPADGDEPARIREEFLAAHRRRYGHGGGGLPVEIVNLRVVALREGPLPSFDGKTRTGRRPQGPRAFVVRGGRVTGSVWALDELAGGVTLQGPAILAGRDATALVESGWCGTVHASGAVLLERT